MKIDRTENHTKYTPGFGDGMIDSLTVTDERVEIVIAGTTIIWLREAVLAADVSLLTQAVMELGYRRAQATIRRAMSRKG